MERIEGDLKGEGSNLCMNTMARNTFADYKPRSLTLVMLHATVVSCSGTSIVGKQRVVRNESALAKPHSVLTIGCINDATNRALVQGSTCQPYKDGDDMSA